MRLFADGAGDTLTCGSHSEAAITCTTPSAADDAAFLFARTGAVSERGMRRSPNHLLWLSLLLPACASTSESGGRDQLTANVGIYPPPASDLPRVRVGVPAFTVAAGVGDTLSPLAADQATTLCASTQRFDVVERAQLDKLLAEQNLEGIVTAGELARPAQVRGVDWLLLGKVTSLRIKRDTTGSSFNLGNIPVPGALSSLGLFGIGNRDVVFKVECGVDLRLVDPTTGVTVCADFSEFNRTDAASAMGLQILGGQTVSTAEIQVNADDQGRILRLALDDCMRKLLPKADQALRARIPVAAVTSLPSSSSVAGTPVVATDRGGMASPTPAAAQFCSQCGDKLAPGAKFCPACGGKV